MLSLPPSVRIYVAAQPTDMRQSFEGLSAQVQGVLQKDPLSGHLFVFRNRRGDRVKILYWDRSGFCLWYKRLERGTFELPSSGEPCLELEWGDLSLLLEGVDLKTARRRRRFRLTA